MDSRQFDRLSRSLAAVGTRRGLTRLLAAVPLLSGLLAFASSPTTAVANDRRDKQRRHRGDSDGQRRHGTTSRQHAHHDGPHADKKRKKKKGKSHAARPPVSPPPGSPPPPPCPDGTTQCGGRCVDTAGQVICEIFCTDLQTDVANCGECTHQCVRGQVCVGGVCGQNCPLVGFCAANSALPDCCKSGCKNFATDVNNCGGCGTVCSKTADHCTSGVCMCGLGPTCQSGQTCTSGVCRCGLDPACQSGQTCCGDAICRNLSSDPTSCGTCFNACPGLGQPQTVVTCDSGHCLFSCDGNNYDINNDPSDGCEQFDSATNHSKETAAFLGNWSCFDSVTGQISGTIYSDTHLHINHEDTQFARSLPLWWKIRAIGGPCENDLFISLVQTSGTKDRAYDLTLITDLSSGSVPIVNGLALIQLGAGSYTQGTDIYISIARSDLTSNVREKADFGIIFHL